jgi:NADH-quinone oxidoreductase subunit A
LREREARVSPSRIGLVAWQRCRASGVSFTVTDYSSLLVYLALVVLLAGFILLVIGRLSPSRPSEAKSRPYECGVSEPQPTAARWPIHFALVAMLFLIFDVEALFFYPWAVNLRELRWNGIMAFSGFFAVLGVGYIYARSRGALKWR